MEVLMALPLDFGSGTRSLRVSSDITCQMASLLGDQDSAPYATIPQAEKKTRQTTLTALVTASVPNGTCAAPTATSWDRCGCASVCVSKTKETSKPLHLPSKQPSPSPNPFAHLRECLPSTASFSFPSFTQPARHSVG
jgi:hypothetical protein